MGVQEVTPLITNSTWAKDILVTVESVGAELNSWGAGSNATNKKPNPI